MYLSYGQEVAYSKFPEDFNKKLAKLIFQILAKQEAEFKAYLEDRNSGLPKLVDFDYRVDLKQFNKNQETVREPILKLKLMVEDSSQDSHIKQSSIELSKDQLNEIISNFEKINA